MTTTLVLPDPIADDIARATQNPLECAGVLLARRVVVGEEVRLLGRALHWVDPSAYIERSAWGLKIRSEGYVGALGLAEADNAIPIWFHTHPGEDGIPLPSRHDVQVDCEIADLFQLRSGTGYYGTLIASPRKDGFGFSGTLSTKPMDCPLSTACGGWGSGGSSSKGSRPGRASWVRFSIVTSEPLAQVSSRYWVICGSSSSALAERARAWRSNSSAWGFAMCS